MKISKRAVVVGTMLGLMAGGCFAAPLLAEEASLPKAFIHGAGPGWKELGESDFVPVNGDPDTWSFKDGGIQCTGKPTGVMRTEKQYRNFEIVLQWKHHRGAGNSGLFVWVPEAALADLPKGKLPYGIEVQMLDQGYLDRVKQSGRATDWFTTHGDVFSVGAAKMDPFPPVSPNGRRSFPRKELSKPAGEWNHYYVRGINGEVRLWVNGEEVSGGSGCDPSSGFLCLESEGSPVEFRNVRVRELP